MSEMTPAEEQEQDDKLLDMQIDAHLEHEQRSKELDGTISDLLRTLVPCSQGPCADCGGSGINPEYLRESMNGEYLVYVARMDKQRPSEGVVGVPI